MLSPVPIHFDLPDVKEVKNKLHLVVELRVAVLCEHDGLVAGRANGEGSLKLEQPQIKLNFFNQNCTNHKWKNTCVNA